MLMCRTKIDNFFFQNKKTSQNIPLQNYENNEGYEDGSKEDEGKEASYSGSQYYKEVIKITKMDGSYKSYFSPWST